MNTLNHEAVYDKFFFIIFETFASTKLCLTMVSVNVQQKAKYKDCIRPIVVELFFTGPGRQCNQQHTLDCAENFAIFFRLMFFGFTKKFFVTVNWEPKKMTCYFWFYFSTACSYQAGSVALGFLTFVAYSVEAYILGAHAPANIGESTVQNCRTNFYITCSEHTIKQKF